MFQMLFDIRETKSPGRNQLQTVQRVKGKAFAVSHETVNAARERR